MKKISTVFIALTIFLSHTNAQEYSSFSPREYALTPFIHNDGLWGYKDKFGDIVIKPKFDFAAPFYKYPYNNNELYAVARHKGKWVIINKSGKIKNKIDADEISLKSNQYAYIYRKDNKYGVINRDGKILTEPIYDFIQPVGTIEAYWITYFIYKINGKIGVSYIDKDENDNSINEFIKPGNIQFYNNDMNPININFYDNSCLAWGDDAGKINLDNSILKLIENNTIVYKKYDIDYYRNQSSKLYTRVVYELDSISPPFVIFPLLNKNVDDIYNSKSLPMPPSKNWYYVPYEKNICRIIKKNGKWGVLFGWYDLIYQSREIDYDNIIYDSILNLNSLGINGFFIAYKSDKCGLINQNSNIILDFKFDNIKPLSANYFALQKDNLWGISYLDSILFKPNYDDYKLKDNYWYLKKGDFWSVFSDKGKMLCDFKYNEIQDFEAFDDGVKFAIVVADKKVGLINQNFKEVLVPKFDEVGIIQYDNDSKDYFVFVKDGTFYGIVNLDKSKVDYNTSLSYSSIQELKNHVIIIKEQIKQKRLEHERKVAENTRIEEQLRIQEEKRQRQIQIAEEQVRQNDLKKMYSQLQSTTMNYISRFLINPNGASWVSYNGPEETRRILNESRNYLPNCDNVFATMITVDATNSFGGYIRSTYILFFKDNYPCHFEDIKAIDKARNSVSRVGDMDNMLSLTLQLNGCGCR